VGEPLAGTFIVAVTPLDNRLNLDEISYQNLIKYYLAANINVVTVLGESAERDLLSEDERQRILRLTFESIGPKLPVVVGTGNESVQSTIRASVNAQDLGASAVMIPPPRRLKTKSGVPNDEAVFEYFSSVGDTIEIPIVVQDFPQNDRPKMSVTLINRLSREISNAKYLKLEDPPTALKLTRIREAAGDSLRVFSAFYGRESYWDLLHGAVGVMTSSPTPEYLVAMYESFITGDSKKAFGIYLDTLPLVHFCSELGLAVRKEVLVRRKVIRTSKMKLQNRELEDSQKRELWQVLSWVEDRVKMSAGVRALQF